MGTRAVKFCPPAGKGLLDGVGRQARCELFADLLRGGGDEIAQLS